MNLPTALLLIIAAIVFGAAGIGYLILAADEVRLRLGQRRAMRDLDELLRGES